MAERHIQICREIVEREIFVTRELDKKGESRVEILREAIERPITIEREYVAIANVDLSDYPKREELARVAFTGEYADLNNEPQNFTDDEWELLW